MKTSFKKSCMLTLAVLTLVWSGLGVTPAYAAASFTASPNPWNAGTVTVGNFVPMTINVTNTGDTLDGSQLQKLISGSSDFAITSSQCPWSWKNGQSCQVYLRFQPSVSGPRSATLSVFIPGVYSLAIPLTGAGAGPAVSIDPVSWDFGEQAVGSVSVVKNFTITNSGTTSLSLGALTPSGEFALRDNACDGATVPAAGTCTFGVTFSPTSTGVKNGSVSIPSNAVPSPNNVSLSGTGSDAPPAEERAKNGGFNIYNGTSKIPTSWAKSATFTSADGKDTTVKKEGKASVKMVGAKGKTKTLTQTLVLGGSSGDTFTFTFWAKGASIPATGTCKAQVLLYDNSTLVSTKTVSCKTGTYAAFQKKTLTFNAASAYTKVVIKFTYSKASGTIWFDGISLMK